MIKLQIVYHNYSLTIPSLLLPNERPSLFLVYIFRYNPLIWLIYSLSCVVVYPCFVLSDERMMKILWIPVKKVIFGQYSNGDNIVTDMFECLCKIVCTRSLEVNSPDQTSRQMYFGTGKIKGFQENSSYSADLATSVIHFFPNLK